MFSVFVQNKAGREDFTVENFTAMQKTLSYVFNSTKLKMKGKPLTTLTLVPLHCMLL